MPPAPLHKQAELDPRAHGDPPCTCRPSRREDGHVHQGGQGRTAAQTCAPAPRPAPGPGHDTRIPSLTGCLTSVRTSPTDAAVGRQRPSPGPSRCSTQSSAAAPRAVCKRRERCAAPRDGNTCVRRPASNAPSPHPLVRLSSLGWRFEYYGYSGRSQVTPQGRQQ